VAAGRISASPVVAVGPRNPATNKVACPRCGGANPGGTLYCQFCGARLDAGPAPVAPRPPAPTRPESPDAHAQVHRSAPPPALNRASLVVIAQDGSRGRDYPLAAEQVDIGREEGDIQLPSDPYVSPRHARLSRRGERWFVTDLASVNGVFVRLRAPHTLAHGDLILIGLEVLRFEAVSDAEKGLMPAAERGVRLFGSPAAPRHARLCQRTVEGVARDVFYVSRDELTIGRESGDVVFTSDPFMSRRHAAIVRDAQRGGFTLKDLGSSNGTYVAIRGEVELNPGDHVRIGQHLFRLDVEGRA
jgi:pSer/pThr/pTyr-binding forkhead associated (FHA) protein